MVRLRIIIGQWWLRHKKIRDIKRRNRRISDAIKWANALSNWDRKTRYVFERGDQFDIMSTSDIKAGRKLGKFARSVNMMDIYERSIYTATFHPQVKEDWKKARTAKKLSIEKKHKK